MNLSADQIERIVRETLAILAEPRPALTPNPSPVERERGVHFSPLPLAGEEQGVRAASDEWVIVDRVVTLARLPDRWDGVRRIVVPPRAVVTPAVRDELARRGIPLESRCPTAARTVEGLRIVLVGLGRSGEPGPLAEVLEAEGIAAEVRRETCLVAATDALAADLRQGPTAAILLSRHSAAALCLANRHGGVRAIAAQDPLAEAADAVGANLLVADPAKAGPFGLRRMVREFLRGAPRSCPEVFQKRLG